MKSLFSTEEFPHKLWAALLFMHFLFVLGRCLFADYIAISNQTDIISIHEILNKEPKFIIAPVSFWIIPLSIYFVLSKIKPIQKLFFVGLIVASLLSLSRRFIDYNILWLFIINHSEAVLLMVCFIPIYISYKMSQPNRK